MQHKCLRTVLLFMCRMSKSVQISQLHTTKPKIPYECLLHMENLKTVAPFVTNEFYEFYIPESMPTSARKQKVLYLPCIWHVGCSKGRPVSSNKVAYQNMIQSCRHCHCATVLPLQRAFHPPLQMRSCQQCVVHWVRGAAQTNDSIVDHTHATHWPLPDPREVRYIEG
jgi:hypothetical protein